ncbi:SAM-dependent methyltransferase [Achlya hypogyna]|uniref:SAM-dependent methyltransferase n=1 Tax=Achlya hypogyna TaxID=1202772 RepID=A0A1V9ZE94_ACHHY|nr:SAM-dependent methyltransferase [Achlya hypogyna]
MEPSSDPAMQVFECVRNMWATRSLATVASLKIPDVLRDGPLRAHEIAAQLDLDRDSVFRLMRAVSSMGFFEHTQGDVFALTASGEYLLSDVPGSMRSYLVAMCAPGHWLPWGNLEHTVRTGTPSTEMELGADLGSYYTKHPDEGHLFNDAMSNVFAISSAICLEVFPFEDLVTDDMTVVDVGGAHGDFLGEVLTRLNRPDTIRGVLFDLPHVVNEAAEFGNLSLDIDCVPGDFFDSVPPGDLYLLKHVLHEWDDASCTTILRNLRAAMPATGRVLIVEIVLEETSDSPLAATSAMLDINTMVMFRGRERTEAEYANLLADAQMNLVKLIRTSTPFSIIEAVAA